VARCRLDIRHLGRAARRLPDGPSGWNAAFVREGRSPSLAGRAVSTAFTFLCVVAAWVFFRATSIEAAFFVCKGMLGMNGVLWPDQWQGAAGTLGARDPALRWARLEAFGGWRQWAWIVVLLAIAWAHRTRRPWSPV
jgi:hypothetical protein